MRPDTIKYMKLSQIILKFATIAGLLSMIIHCILLVSGISLTISELLFGFGIITFGYFLLLSKALNLCKCFRIAITYLFVVNICIFTQKNFQIFGDLLQPTRILVAFLGIMIFSNIIFTQIRKNIK